MQRIYLFIAIVGIIVADYLTKLWIVQNIEYLDGFVVFEYLNIVRVHNTGAAFGFLSGYGGWQLWFLTILAIIISVILSYYLVTKPLGNSILLLAFVFIIAGALGNSLDRLLYGFVVDFIDFHYKDWHYPAFNIADISISCGAVLLLVDILFSKSND